MTHRIVPWTTGDVGRQSVPSIVAHPTSRSSAASPESPDEAGRILGSGADVVSTAGS